MSNKFEIETRERYGNTAAYREHEQKTKNYTKEKWAEANEGLMAIFAEFAACKDSGASANSDDAQALVAKLQAHITENYYTCTDEILAGLGKMYVADERFKKNIDKYGERTSIFVFNAIACFCESLLRNTDQNNEDTIVYLYSDQKRIEKRRICRYEYNK